VKQKDRLLLRFRLISRPLPPGARRQRPSNLLFELKFSKGFSLAHTAFKCYAIVRNFETVFLSID